VGKGIFSEIGHPHEGDERYVILKRGIMMGDPLTKVILHLTNISSRCLGRFIGKGLYKDMVFDRPTLLSDEYTDTTPIPVLIPENENMEDRRPLRLPMPVDAPNPELPRVIPRRRANEVVDLLRTRYTSSEEMITSLIPGVHAVFENEDGAIDIGFIPKKQRNPLMRGKLFSFSFGPKIKTWSGNFDIDDHILLMNGQRPVPLNILYARMNRTEPPQIIEEASAPRISTNLWSWFGF